MSRPNLPKSTPAELDEFLVRMIRDGHAVFDPVIEKYKLTKTGEQFVDYYTGKPPSKERIRKVMEQLVDADRYRRYAAELVALAPDVILATGASTAGPLLQVTHTLPIVFVQTTDPVGIGLVASLARPGGNATGFLQFEYSLSGKWPELLKQIASNVTRVAVLRDPALGSSTTQFAVIQALAPSLRMEVTPVDVRDVGEIERAVTAFARGSNGGLIVTSSVLAQVHRELIITLAARHRLPAVYPYRFFITSGGLISYGPDNIDQYRRAAGYVDRILKGEQPADLPVQAPTKYETVLNLKTAKALGLTIPETLLATADEVIQ